jgi:predicted aconitase
MKLNSLYHFDYNHAHTYTAILFLFCITLRTYRTTLNSQSCDRRQWSNLGVDANYAQNANAVGDAYVQLGCEGTSFTCAPYLLPTRPKLGENIIWGESNAVVYSNSVRDK